MKLYILYIVSAILNFFSIMFLLGLSAGFANPLPILSLTGSILLFIIATPVVVFKVKVGAVLGAISISLMLPYNFMSLISTLKNINDNTFGSYLFLLPVIINFITIGYLFKKFQKKSFSVIKPGGSNSIKLVLSCLPVILFAIYLISIWKYISFS